MELRLRRNSFQSTSTRTNVVDCPNVVILRSMKLIRNNDVAHFFGGRDGDASVVGTDTVVGFFGSRVRIRVVYVKSCLEGFTLCTRKRKHKKNSNHHGFVAFSSFPTTSNQSRFG